MKMKMTSSVTQHMRRPRQPRVQPMLPFIRKPNARIISPLKGPAKLCTDGIHNLVIFIVTEKFGSTVGPTIGQWDLQNNRSKFHMIEPPTADPKYINNRTI